MISLEICCKEQFFYDNPQFTTDYHKKSYFTSDYRKNSVCTSGLTN